MAYNTSVKIGNDIFLMKRNVENLNERYIAEELNEFLETNFETDNGKYYPRICALYGLRRTGKTTMMLQELQKFDEDKLSKSAWINVTQNDSMASVYQDLDTMYKQGIQYVFIDEITKAQDFIRVSSLLSDEFARSGMHIVITGTDSLGIFLARKSELYDRIIMIHTTYIPYYEYTYLFPNATIDDYIENGGLLSESGMNYNHEKSIKEYVDTAIAENIQHSLKYLKDDSKLGSLFSVHKKGELTDIINRVVENQNHIFALEVVLEDFESRDVGSMMDLITKSKNDTTLQTLAQQIDVAAITKAIKKQLKILNEDDRITQLTPSMLSGLEQYFEDLDFIETCEAITVRKETDVVSRNLLVQPAIRYNQAKIAIKALQKDKAFKKIPKELKGFVEEKMLTDIKGRMMEEIILLNFVKAFPDAEIQTITFKEYKKSSYKDGEFDAVIWKDDGDSLVSEIKHNNIVDYDNQTKHLRDENKLNLLKESAYNVTERIVFYNGKTTPIDSNGVQYVNAGEYLESLKEFDRNYQRRIEREQEQLIRRLSKDPEIIQNVKNKKGIDLLKPMYSDLTENELKSVVNKIKEDLERKKALNEEE